MAMAVLQNHPVAHLPLVLGVLRRLEVATVIDRLLPPHPVHVLSCGRGVEALLLAILMAIMPSIRWGHAWRIVGCSPHSSRALTAHRSMIIGWARS